jgi:hypothetical protein
MRAAFLVVTIASAVVVTGAIGALALTVSSSMGQPPCPSPSRAADATRFVLCLDGLLFDKGIGETPVNGRVQVSVPTRWVDAQWVRGQLGAAADPDRWELRYTTYTIENG